VITAPNIVLAVGSKLCFAFTIAGERNTKITRCSGNSKTLTIIGGGVTGVEMASMFAELVLVTVLNYKTSFYRQDKGWLPT
jgi:pyruvate/2-oxoglutarate dehydrogenase complex dihydrolipoamide dehydrogenase (E3) component